MRGVALGLLDTVYHVPFLREYFLRIIEISEGTVARVLGPRDRKILAERCHDYCEDTWGFLLHRYGLTAGSVQAFAVLLQRVKDFPARLDWTLLGVLSRMDV